MTEMQRRFNRHEPVVFNTVQCYLRDSRERLLTDLERARREARMPATPVQPPLPPSAPRHARARAPTPPKTHT